MSKKNENPLVTVGIPVFNGEKFLERRIESILSQNYKEFKILISDNASNDSTQEICKKFVNQDNRISYHRQEKNLGYVTNFNYLINNANGKYFVIAGVDDLWEPDFLEKNVSVLENNENIVGSIGDVDYIGNFQKPKSSKFITNLKKNMRKQDIDIQEKHVIKASGKFDDKVDRYLRFNQGSFVYGLYRTSEIKKNIITSPVAAWDLVFILNILKFGDLHVVDKILLHKYAGGMSTKGILESYKRREIPFYDLLIPNFSFFKWSAKNIGIGFCLRNLDWFILLTIYGWYAILKKLK
ncbi:glycosyltransferase family 2 protein [Nitrosopumilus adriaticus]|uniref:glycosyltransferase family 2 protein n=1 Tax=Nitrosopumilus adriaticus TaxID=1580092 RepID=UPI00352F2C58